MIIRYRIMEQNDLDHLAKMYKEYYNHVDQAIWTYDRAFRRVEQILTMKDAHCIIQYNEIEITGLVLGYIKTYDDIDVYHLEEILIFHKYQNQGLGTLLMEKTIELAKEKGASRMQLDSVNDEMHDHFYAKFDFQDAKNLVIKGKQL